MRTKRSHYFWLLLIFPFLFLLQNAGFTEPVHHFSLTILKPVLLTGHAITSSAADLRDGVIHFWQTFRSQGQLEDKVARLESELQRTKEISKENERLRKLVDFRSTLSGKTIAARVIGWDSFPWRKTIILDKGKRDGIKKDMPVLVPEGLVGRVLETAFSTSRVILLMDPECRVSAMTDQSRAQGLVLGDGSSILKLGYLELESGIAVEENVITSGVGEIYPKGIRIGTLKSLAKDPTGLHLEAQVQSSVKFSKLEEVLCLVSSRGK